MPTIKFERGGGVKAIWDDSLAGFFARAFGPEFAAARRRASIIMTIPEGRFAGFFYASMVHLAELTADGEHNLCLYPPRQLEKDCRADEVAYIMRELICKVRQPEEP